MPTNPGNAPKLLFCATCQTHTEHRDLPNMYATQCLDCNAITNTLMRLQAEQLPHALSAPDGTTAQILENTPDDVTFYVGTGEHKGYYYHDKRTGQNEIRQA